MPRHVVQEAQIHPAVREKISTYHLDLIDEVRDAVAKNDVVVVGMSQNPNPGRACRALAKKGVQYKHLSYGSYFSLWRRRLALKMWTGWSTFPMIWVKGTFVGGADDLEKLIASGELDTMLAGPRNG